MKNLNTLCILALLTTALGCSDGLEIEPDQLLADKLSADDYMYTLTLEELMQIEINDLE